MTIKIHTLQELEFASVVSDYILEIANQTIKRVGLFKLVLSGGSTPVHIFQQLVVKQSQIDWSKLKIYWVDERCVPVDSSDSNYGVCKKYLLDLLTVKPETFPMYLSGSASDAAQKYEGMLKRHLLAEQQPYFDLALLGIGVDGHIASLFPATQELNEMEKWVVATRSPEHQHDRVSMTFPLIKSVKNCVIVAKGKEKEWVFDACVDNSFKHGDIPACRINPVLGNIDWFVSFK